MNERDRSEKRKLRRFASNMIERDRTRQRNCSVATWPRKEMARIRAEHEKEMAHIRHEAAEKEVSALRAELLQLKSASTSRHSNSELTRLLATALGKANSRRSTRSRRREQRRPPSRSRSRDTTSRRRRNKNRRKGEECGKAQRTFAKGQVHRGAILFPVIGRLVCMK